MMVMAAKVDFPSILIALNICFSEEKARKNSMDTSAPKEGFVQGK